MGAPFRSGAAVPACAARRSLALARIALTNAERHLDSLVLQLRRGHIQLAPGRRDDLVLREANAAVFKARQALDEARYRALGADALWDAAGCHGLPTSNDEDDLGTALHLASEANWAAALDGAEPPGEPTFRDDVRATYRAGAGY
jgi:hypothetical protein